MLFALFALTVALLVTAVVLAVKDGIGTPELDAVTVSLDDRPAGALPDEPGVLLVAMTMTNGRRVVFRCDPRVAHHLGDGLIRGAIGCAPKREVRA